MANPLRDMSLIMQVLLALAITVVLVVVGVYVPGSPVAQERDQVDKAVRERAQLTQEVTQLQVYRQRYSELKSQMDALNKQLDTLKTIVPEEKETDEFIRLVQGAAAASNVQLRRLTSQAIVTKEYHYEMPFEVQADGPYFNILDFFGRLSRLSRIINVGDLVFADPASSSNKGAKYPVRPGTTVSGVFTATTFFTKPSDAGATTGPAKPAGETLNGNERNMRFVKTLVLGITLAAAGAGLHAQTSPASGAGTTPATHAAAKPAPQSAKPAAKPAAQTPAKPAAAQVSAAQNKPAPPAANKPAAAASKPAPPKTGASTAGQTGKPATPRTAKPAPKPAVKKAAPKTKKPVAAAKSSGPAVDKEPKVAKRDPFESLVGHEQGGGKTGPFPPGKAGLQVSTLRLDGIVRAPAGMIAVVSNPQSRTYFLREGDQLYDGRVERIAMDGVSFHEVGKDAFGKPVERQVNKRIYASAGEQQ